MRYHKFQNSTSIKGVGVNSQAKMAKSNNRTSFESPLNFGLHEFLDFVSDLK